MDLLRHVLAEQPQGLLTEDDSTTLVIDCGATSTMTYDLKDFKPGTLRMFEKGEKSPIQGIASTLPILGQGLLSLQVVDDKGEIVKIETDAYYIPDLQTKLFSPQAYFAQRNDKSELTITRTKAIMRLAPCQEGEETHEIVFTYNQQTHLPMM